MSKVIKAYQYGDPTVFVTEDEALGSPGSHEVKSKQYAIGVNYADTLVRRGLMPVGKFPYVDGFEAAGVITEVGSEVNKWKADDRVAYYMQIGAYAQARIVPEDALVSLPDSLSFENAAALLIKGLTAEMLISDNYSVKTGDIILIQGTSGGVASLITLWANALGAKVIAVVRTQEKKKITLANGAFAAIVSSEESIAEKVQKLTNGKGVDVVYDGVGRATFLSSVESLRSGGTLVQYGFASGPVSDDLVKSESRKREIHVKSTQLGDYIYDAESLQRATKVLFAAFLQGIFWKQNIQTYHLTDASHAHEDMENRKTHGAVILLP